MRNKESQNQQKQLPARVALVGFMVGGGIFLSELFKPKEVELPNIGDSGRVTNAFGAIIDWNEISYDKKRCVFEEGDNIFVTSEIEYLAAPGARENMYDGMVVEVTDGECTANPTLTELKENVQFDKPKK